MTNVRELLSRETGKNDQLVLKRCHCRSYPDVEMTEEEGKSAAG
jgi:hypothetical protein